MLFLVILFIFFAVCGLCYKTISVVGGTFCSVVVYRFRVGECESRVVFGKTYHDFWGKYSSFQKKYRSFVSRCERCMHPLIGLSSGRCENSVWRSGRGATCPDQIWKSPCRRVAYAFSFCKGQCRGMPCLAPRGAGSETCLLFVVADVQLMPHPFFLCLEVFAVVWGGCGLDGNDFTHRESVRLEPYALHGVVGE